MPGREDDYGRSREADAYERHWRELEARERGYQDRAFDPRQDDEDRRWRAERAAARYEPDRTHHGRGRGPDWQERGWQGGSPGLSHGAYQGRRSFGRADDYGYGGQEYGMEAHRDFGRSPESVQRVTDGEDGRDWRERFGDDGRPHPRFRDDDRGRTFERNEDDGYTRQAPPQDERRFYSDAEDRRRARDQGHLNWRDEGGPYGDTHIDRPDLGMTEFGVPHDYGLHPSRRELGAGGRDERRYEDERRLRADQDRREEEWRRDRWSRDRDW